MGAVAPLSTGCILKQVNILHENALFLHIFFKFEKKVMFPPQTPPSTLPPLIQNFWIRNTMQHNTVSYTHIAEQWLKCILKDSRQAGMLMSCITIDTDIAVDCAAFVTKVFYKHSLISMRDILMPSPCFASGDMTKARLHKCKNNILQRIKGNALACQKLNQ